MSAARFMSCLRRGLSLAALAIFASLTAEANPVGDGALGTMPSASETGVAGGTPRDLGFTSTEAGMLLSGRVEQFRDAGYLTPIVGDVEAYDPGTVMGLYEWLEGNADAGPCVQAVRTALYLDAHLEEASYTEVAKGYQDTIGRLAIRLLEIEKMPSWRNVVLVLYPGLWPVDRALKIYETYHAFRKNYHDSPTVRKGRWTHEIVARAQEQEWPVGRIHSRRAQMLDEAQDMIQRLATLQGEIDETAEQIEKRYKAEVEAADEAFEGGERAQRWLQPSTEDEQQHMHALIEANVERKRALAAMLKEYFKKMADAQLELDRLFVQRDALARYAEPLARGDCEEIRREGPVPGPKEKPDAVKTALGLPAEKVIPFLEHIDARPSEDYLDCLCHNAYGASGTRRFHHPAPIPDSSPACERSGPPCIVAGWGCSRHPLPSETAVWEQCATRTGEDVRGAIEQAVDARRRAAE